MRSENGCTQDGAKQPSTRASPQLLRDLRSLHVCVFHPHDRDGELLTQQLQRGAAAEAQVILVR
jgi:hypothetical protein